MCHTPLFDSFPGLKGQAIIALLLSALTFATAPSARCQEPEAPAKAKPVCLDVTRIDHTEVLNDHQIVFHMYGRKTWINNLVSRCTTLTRQDGFVWRSGIPEYCDNVETIRVIRTGEVCLLGAFTPYVKPAKAS